GGGVHVRLADLDVRPPLEHGEHHADPGGVEPRGDPARHLEYRVAHECLNLGEQRSAALQGHGDAGAGHRLTVPGKEQAARVGEPDQAVLAQVETANLVGRAVAVLDRADHPQPRVPVTLEVQDHVDE